MTISASIVKELRERTGAGMMECKKALEGSRGDIELAIENMRKAGQAKADKKAGRVAAEGLVKIVTKDSHLAAMVEVNSETDFVARSDDFQHFVNAVAETALRQMKEDVSALSKSALKSGDAQTVEQVRQVLVAKLGENITLRRVALYNAQKGFVGTYTHGGRIGVLVNLHGGDESLAKDIAMHIAASKPEVVNPEDLSEERKSKEAEIFSAQAAQSGKPAEIVEKMVAGRIKKFLDEVSLVGQPFVKDPDKKVEDVLKAAGAKVLSFVRFEVGEGIEKEETDFAAEVMAQAQGVK